MDTIDFSKTMDFHNFEDKVKTFISPHEIRNYKGVDSLYDSDIIKNIAQTLLSDREELGLKTLHEVLITRKLILNVIN